MKRTVQTTGILFGAFMLLLGVDVAVWMAGDPPPVELPRLADVDLTQIRKIRLTRDDQLIELERAGDGADWRLATPIQGPADRDAINDLLLRLRRGLPMEARLDEGNLAAYGLEQGLRLEIFAEGSPPLIDVIIGNDTVGGASFVRFPNEEVVYRAQIGGRHRLDRAARDWRDTLIYGFEPGAVGKLTIEGAEPTPLVLTRDQGRWVLPEDPAFAVDQPTVDQVLQRLGGLRAGRVLPGDFPIPGVPALRIVVERPGLDPLEYRFWVQGESAYVKAAGRDEVFQVATSVPQRVALPRQALPDRQLLSLDRASILRMTWHDQVEGDFILEQDAADSRWRMVQPKNVDANLRDAMQAAVQLSGLRAAGIAVVDPSEAGFPSPTWIDLEMRDGARHRLELGKRTLDPEGKPTVVFVRTPERPDRIGVLPLQELLQIRAAWSK